MLLALLAGFAVKVPLFPVHTWLPLAHTEAPTAGSVILAAVLLKLGTYGLYRFVLPMVPEAVVEYAPFIAVFAIIGILYAALICWVQSDVKQLVAYSSVSHLGFCVLGLFALNPLGVQGSVLYMINHGLSTGALFFLIGMIYERYHTRDMEQIGGLSKRMPVWAFFMVFFTLSSVGLPGLNGFVSEFLCLIGAFTASAGRGDLSRAARPLVRGSGGHRHDPGGDVPAHDGGQGGLRSAEGTLRLERAPRRAAAGRPQSCARSACSLHSPCCVSSWASTPARFWKRWSRRSRRCSPDSPP